MAAAAAAAEAEGPLSYDGPEEEEQAQQAQQARQRQGLNQDSLLGIMGEDEFWKVRANRIGVCLLRLPCGMLPSVAVLPAAGLPRGGASQPQPHLLTHCAPAAHLRSTLLLLLALYPSRLSSRSSVRW